MVDVLIRSLVFALGAQQGLRLAVGTDLRSAFTFTGVSRSFTSDAMHCGEASGVNEPLQKLSADCRANSGGMAADPRCLGEIGGASVIDRQHRQLSWHLLLICQYFNVF